MIYYVLLAPILFKSLEWIIQLFTYGVQSHPLAVYGTAGGVMMAILGQLIFSIVVSGILFAAIISYQLDDSRNLDFNIFRLSFVPAGAYLIKEIWNTIFIYKSLSGPVLIALTIEPFAVWLLFGLLPYYIFFRNTK